MMDKTELFNFFANELASTTWRLNFIAEQINPGDSHEDSVTVGKDDEAIAHLLEEMRVDLSRIIVVLGKLEKTHQALLLEHN